jgi:2'-5' RNA ligase
VAGDERLRLFLALQPPDSVVEALAEWRQRKLRGRIVPPHNLHVTLAFVAPSGAAAFLSRLHPSGAVYEVLESFPLNRRRSGG